MKDIDKLKKQLEEAQSLWSKYSCDCLAFELNYLEQQIKALSRLEDK